MEFWKLKDDYSEKLQKLWKSAYSKGLLILSFHSQSIYPNSSISTLPSHNNIL